MEEFAIDCSSIEGSRRYCSPDAEKRLRELIGGRYRGVHHLGSGDYHYLSRFFCENVPEPFDLLLFDHHPDMQAPAFDGVISCGGWVRDLLEGCSQLHHVTIIGIAPELLCETEGFQDRVSVFQEGTTVPSPAPSELPLYVSVDKDVFCTCCARTNWDQGSLDLPLFGRLLDAFTAGRRILGLDICGSLPLEEGGTAEDAAVNRRTDSFIIEALKDRLI